MTTLTEATLAQYPNPFANEPCIQKQAQVLSDVSHVLEGAESFGATSEEILEAGFNAFQIDSILFNVQSEIRYVQEKLDAFSNQLELDLQ